MGTPATSVKPPAGQRFLFWLRRHREPILRYVMPILTRAGLARPTLRIYEWALGLGQRDERAFDDGLPVPPPALRVLVFGPTLEDFLDTGRSAAADISQFLERSGLPLQSAGALLDFGCGCGRVIRHWRDLDGVEVHGTDYNERLVAWCRANLPQATFATNGLEPPTPYPADRFGAIYALSVFTHLDEPRQFEWMSELRRILRPGGRILFTTHGVPYLDVLLPEERARYDRGELVVRFEGEAGSNLCNAFHPESWVRERLITGGLEVELFEPAAGAGTGSQDVWVVSRPAG